MPVSPFALFITWTTYGTWLPGDPRGYVSNTLLPGGAYERKRNQRGTPCGQDDPATLAAARRFQEHATVWLTQTESRVAAEAIRQAAVERDWVILRAACMANHIHSLITNCPADGPAVRRVIKGVSSAALSEAAGAPRRWWTRGGSDRYLHDQAAIAAADRYIHNQSGMLCEIVVMRVIPRK